MHAPLYPLALALGSSFKLARDFRCFNVDLLGFLVTPRVVTLVRRSGDGTCQRENDSAIPSPSTPGGIWCRVGLPADPTELLSSGVCTVCRSKNVGLSGSTSGVCNSNDCNGSNDCINGSLRSGSPDSISLSIWVLLYVSYEPKLGIDAAPCNSG